MINQGSNPEQVQHMLGNPQSKKDPIHKDQEPKKESSQKQGQSQGETQNIETTQVGNWTYNMPFCQGCSYGQPQGYEELSNRPPQFSHHGHHHIHDIGHPNWRAHHE